MSDKELLEDAAKTAGVDLAWSSNEDQSPRDRATWNVWNPLVDDGDALRLAVKLRMNIVTEVPHAIKVGWMQDQPGAPTRDGLGPWFWKEWIHEHPTVDAATRRAIVRAAASIRRAGKES
jgi:hypothetical protein